MSPKPDKITQLFSAYIKEKKVLIADTNAASRAGIAKFFNNLGAKSTNLIVASNHQIAEAEIEKHKPHIVVCDYDLGPVCGLQLLQKQREKNKDFDNSLFVLVTGNTSQSAVAQAAEEDVDTFILKPYTLDVFRQSLMKAAIQKIQPSEYVKAIKQGKAQLDEKNLDEAIELFEKAATLDSKPSLACYYMGQTRYIKELLEEAQSDFTDGLKHNKIHYKCMVGLFDLLMQKQDWLKAYEVVKKLSRYFPANPKRLSTVLRLAIMTKSYDDIEGYYRIFTSLEERNDEIIRYVCAALVVVGKHYLAGGHRKRAFDLFQNASVAAGARVKVLREIITGLTEHDLTQEAEKYLKRFPTESQKEADYIASTFMIREKGTTSSSLVDEGRKHIQAGIHDPTIYKVLIRVSRAHGLTDYAEHLTDDAKKRWPELEKELDSTQESSSQTA